MPSSLSVLPVVLLISCTSVFARCKNEVSALSGMNLGVNTGVNAPAVTTKGEARLLCSFGEFEFTAEYSPLRKIQTGEGYSAGGTLRYRHYLKRNWFLGAGLGTAVSSGGYYTKLAYFPQLGAGWRNSVRMFEVIWNFRERQTPNFVEGAQFKYREDFYLWNRPVGLRAEINVSVISFFTTGVHDAPVERRIGRNYQVYLGIVCCRKPG